MTDALFLELAAGYIYSICENLLRETLVLFAVSHLCVFRE